MNQLNYNTEQQKLVKDKIIKQEAEQLRKKRKHLSVIDFPTIAIIGRGAFGEVRLCRSLDKKELVAVKKMKKTEMIQKNQLSHLYAERDILTKCKKEWIVNLKQSFQD